MIFRSIDASNDWAFGSGKSSYATGERAIEINIRTRLLSFLNDCFWRMDFGIDWMNLLGGKNPTAQAQILLQTRTMIIGSEGVVKINSVNTTLDARTRKLSVSYNIDTIYTRGLSRAVSIA